MKHDSPARDGRGFRRANRKAALRRAPARPELRALLDRAGSATLIAFHRLDSGARS